MKTPIEYIEEAVKIYTKKENFIFFARIMAVVVIISTTLSLVFGYVSGYAVNNFEIFSQQVPTIVSSIIFFILIILVTVWTKSVTYMSIIKMGEKEKEVFRLGYRKMWKFLLISSSVVLITALGLVLLIIPGVIFIVWFLFSIYLVMDKGLSVKAALKESKNMVKGKFWKVLGRSLVFVLFSLFVSLLLVVIPYVGSLTIAFIAPIFMLPTYLLYKDLR